MGLKVGVSEGRVPTGGEGRAVAEVTGVGLKEGLGAGTCDEAGAKVRVEKSTADKVCAVEGGGGARGSGVGDRREKSEVFEGEESIGKVGEGLANARETGGREENIKTTVVVRSPECRGGSRTCGRGESRRRRQVCREGGRGGKRSQRAHGRDHDEQRGKGLETTHAYG